MKKMIGPSGLLMLFLFSMCCFSKENDIAFVGDSITAGGGYTLNLQILEVLTNSDSRRIFYNCGVNGGVVADALRRVRSDILRHNPGSIAVMYGMNDIGRKDYLRNAPASAAARKAESLKRYRKSLTELVETLKAERRNIILMTPTPFNEYSRSGGSYSGLNECGLAAAAQIVRSLAAEKNCGLIELYSPMSKWVKTHPESPIYAGDNIHPAGVGNLFIALHIRRFLTGDQPVRETTVPATMDQNGTFTFQHVPQHLPYLHNNDYQQLLRLYPAAKSLFQSDILRITGLPDDRWILYSEWERLGTFSTAELERGIDLDALETPMQLVSGKVFEAAEKVRNIDRRLRSIHYGYEVLSRLKRNYATLEDAISQLEQFADQNNSSYHKKCVRDFKRNAPLQEKLEQDLTAGLEEMRRAAQPQPYKLILRREGGPTASTGRNSGDQGPYCFEAEEILDQEDPNRKFWKEAKHPGTAWGTLGTLLCGPVVTSDGEPHEEASKTVRLKFELPCGTYRVSARGGRSVGLSFDGGINFLRVKFPDSHGEVQLLDRWKFTGGVCTIFLSGCYAEKEAPRRGRIYLDYLKFERLDSPAGEKKVRLRAETNKPYLNLFSVREKPEIIFTLENLTARHTGKMLLVRVVDERGSSILSTSFKVQGDAAGRWRTRWYPPAKKKGFYRVFADFDNVTLSGVGTKPSGFITYGITFDPAGRRLYPSSRTFFGMQGRFFGKTVEALPLLGIRWVILQSQWKNLEPTHPGQLGETIKACRAEGKNYWLAHPLPHVTFKSGGTEKDWVTYFYCTGIGANNCHPEKWDPPACIGYSPSWGTIGPWGVLTETGKRGFGLYMDALAEAVTADYPPGDAPRIYEILWEPTAYFSGKPEDLVEYLKIASASLKKFAPNARLAAPTLDRLSYESTVFGSPAAGQDNFLEYTRKLFKAGMGRYLDIYSIHPYTKSNRSPEENRMAEAVRELKKLLRAETGREIPIIGTEHGYSSSSCESELRNARFLIRGNLILLGEGVKFNMAFYPCFPSSNGSDYGFFYCTEPKKRTMISPRPQVPAYAAMTYFLEGFRGTESLDLPGSARGYAYENGEKVVLALWDYRQKNRSLTLPVGKKTPRAFDWMGNEMPIFPKDGFVTVQLGPEVIYLLDVDPECFGHRAQRPKITFDTPRIALLPGGKAMLDVTLKAADSKPVSAAMIVESEVLSSRPSRVQVTLQPGERKRMKINITALPSAPHGEHALVLRLKETESEEDLARAEFPVEVLPLVNVLRVEPLFLSDGTPIARMILRNRGAKSLTTELVFQIEEKRYRRQSKLAPGREVDMEIPLTGFAADPKKKYKYCAQIFSNGTPVGGKRAAINFTPVYYFSEGALKNRACRNWEQVPSIRLGREDCRRNGMLYSGDRADIRFGWNREAFFLLAKVKDNVILQTQKNAGNLWRDDCLQWGFCLEPWKERVDSGNTLIDRASAPKTMEFVLSRLSGCPAVCLSQALPGVRNSTGKLLAEDEFQYSITEKEGQLIYEAAIPWRTLGLSCAPEHLGSTIAVNDRDRLSTGLSAMSLFDGAGDDKNPELMGVFTLIKEKKIKIR